MNAQGDSSSVHGAKLDAGNPERLSIQDHNRCGRVYGCVRQEGPLHGSNAAPFAGVQGKFLGAIARTNALTDDAQAGRILNGPPRRAPAGTKTLTSSTLIGVPGEPSEFPSVGKSRKRRISICVG